MESCDRDEIRDCTIKLRENPWRRRERVTVGCGAGFGGDRPLAALKLLQRVKQLDYLVLECLAERTLVDRYRAMESGGDGYDSRISDWMRLLLPFALERGTRIITNMGAMDPFGAQEKVLEIANSMGLSVSVGVAHEASVTKPGHEKSYIMEGGISTYLGAAPIVECLEKYQPNIVITSRVADVALFLAPMVYELGWNWDSFEELANGSLAGHLLECGCQLTGGYFMHPVDKYRDMPLTCLLDLSLPYAEVSSDGRFFVAKAIGSGGVLNFSTCAQQLLYEVGDPKAYITPDIIIDLQDVSFSSSSSCKVVCTGAKPSFRLVPDKLLQLIPKDCGWKGWGEISYGGRECVKRTTAAEFLVRSWLEEVFPGLNNNVLSYIIGVDSLKANNESGEASEDVRLRMDGLFKQEEQAIQFTREFTALYTNGPAGGGGISVGHKKEIGLDKHLVSREQVYWRIGVKHNGAMNSRDPRNETDDHVLKKKLALQENLGEDEIKISSPELDASPAMSGQKIQLYRVAHGRAGDKGNNLNISVIPHFLPDIERLKLVVTPEWVLETLSSFLDPQVILKRDLDETSEVVTVEIYQVRGIQSLNIVIQNILDGGVNCSRWIDRHGKTVSDVILCQKIVMP